MEKLGDDALGSVLNKVLDRRDRKSCSEVCKQWKRVEGRTRTSLRVLDTESLRSFLPRFPNLVALVVGGRISNLDLEFVAETCPYLQNLDVNRTERVFEELEGLGSDDIGDDGLCSIAFGCQFLRKVSLRRRKRIGAVGVDALVKFARNLTVLDLSWCDKVTDRDLEAIGAASSLQVLNLHGCSLITDRGLASLATGSSSKTLKKLDLSECDRISDNGVFLLQHMDLEKLSLSDCGPAITDTGGVAIAAIRSLRKLYLSWLINLLDVTLLAVSRNCWNLVELNVTGCELVSGVGIRSLSGHKSLAALVMASCYNVSEDDVVQMVLGCQSLRYIGLDRAMRGWLSAPMVEILNWLCIVDWL